MTNMQTLANASPVFGQVADWINGTGPDDIPPEVIDFAKLLILDLTGVAIGASNLDVSRIAANHAVRHWAAGPGAPSARLLFDGRETSLPGFGFSLATQIDNLDAHDGLQPSKGHAGAALFPALAAFAQDVETPLSGRDALAAMVVGYEISYRAAIALHATVPDYHTSGAWNALGCSAIGAKLRGTDSEILRHAFGIAEYHGPRSQIMREIANPTMLHDGTGWGAPTGIYALLIAEDGFEGAPAATIEFDDAAFAWEDLGRRWLTNEQYIKPYPTCRWAHAAIDAALQLRAAHDLRPEQIEHVEIRTFAYAADLNPNVPTTTSNAQYSINWPVAAAFARGFVGVDVVDPTQFSDPVMGELTNKISAVTDPEIDKTFPDERVSRLIIKTVDGRTLDSGIVEATGGPAPLPTESEVVEKFRRFAGAVISNEDVNRVQSLILSLDQDTADFTNVVEELSTIRA